MRVYNVLHLVKLGKEEEEAMLDCVQITDEALQDLKDGASFLEALDLDDLRIYISADSIYCIEEP